MTGGTSGKRRIGGQGPLELLGELPVSNRRLVYVKRKEGGKRPRGSKGPKGPRQKMMISLAVTASAASPLVLHTAPSLNLTARRALVIVHGSARRRTVADAAPVDARVHGH